MDDAGFIIGSYVVTFGAIIAYAVAVIRRGRKLSEIVPDDDKYWS